MENLKRGKKKRYIFINGRQTFGGNDCFLKSSLKIDRSFRELSRVNQIRTDIYILPTHGCSILQVLENAHMQVSEPADDIALLQ